MGGKHKQAQRTKNNARPSSSGRSAELLGNQAPKFVGFGAAKDGGYVPVLPGFSLGGSDVLDPNISADFQIVLKKMNKKDATTKLKALQEFAELVGGSEEREVSSVLPFWPRLYGHLAVDAEHRVREAAHLAQRAVVRCARRNLAPYLRQLVGPWFTSQYDTHCPAASAAAQSFQEAFPPNKVPEVIVFCQNEILNYIHDNIIVQKPQTVGNPQALSKEELEAKHERLLVGSLQGYALYLDSVPPDGLAAARDSNRRITSSKKFWKYNRHPSSLVRSAWFKVVAALCQKTPDLVSEESAQATLAVFSNLDEADPVVLSAVWDAALHVVTTLQDCWAHVSAEKLVLPKLWSVLKQGGRGSAAAIFPSLLPLLSRLPDAVVRDRAGFFPLFFSHMRQGFSQKCVYQSISESNAVARCYTECLRFVLVKHFEKQDLCLDLIENHLVPAVELALQSDSRTLAAAVFRHVAALAGSWDGDERLAELQGAFWAAAGGSVLRLLKDRDPPARGLLDHVSLLCSCLGDSSHDRARPQHRVKFAGVEEGADCDDPTPVPRLAPGVHLKGLVRDVCRACLEGIAGGGLPLFLPLLASLLRRFGDEELLASLAGDRPPPLAWAEATVSEWLRPGCPCPREVVAFTFVLLEMLPETDRLPLLEHLSQLARDGSLLVWFLEAAVLHRHVPAVREWLSGAGCRPFLLCLAGLSLGGPLSREAQGVVRDLLKETPQAGLLLPTEAVETVLRVYLEALSAPWEALADTSCVSLACELVASLHRCDLAVTFELLRSPVCRDLVVLLFDASCRLDAPYRGLHPEAVGAWSAAVGAVSCARGSGSDDLRDLLDKFAVVLRRKLLEPLDPEDAAVHHLALGVARGLLECAARDPTGRVDIAVLATLHARLLDAVSRDAPGWWAQAADLCLYALSAAGTLHSPEAYPGVTPLPAPSEVPCFSRLVALGLFSALLLSELRPAGDDDDDDDEEPAMFRCLREHVISVVYTLVLGTTFSFHYKSTSYASAISTKLATLFTHAQKLLDDLSSVELAELAASIYSRSRVDGGLWLLVKDLPLSASLDLTGCERLEEDETPHPHAIQLYWSLRPSPGTGRPAPVEAVLRAPEVADPTLAAAAAWCRGGGSAGERGFWERCTAHASDQLGREALLWSQGRDAAGLSWEEVSRTVCLLNFTTAVLSRDGTEAWSGLASDGQALLPPVLQALAECRSQLLVPPAGLRPPLSPSRVEPAAATGSPDDCKAQVVAVAALRLLSQLRSGRQSWESRYTGDVCASLLQLLLSVSERADVHTLTCHDVPLLESLVSAVTGFETEELFSGWGVEKIAEFGCDLLTKTVSELQQVGYHVLKSSLKHLVRVDSEALERCVADSGDEAEVAAGLGVRRLHPVLDHVQGLMEALLSDFSPGDCCLVRPHTDSFAFARAYLLAWDLLLAACARADAGLRFHYASQLSDQGYVASLLQILFRLMPEDVVHLKKSKNMEFLQSALSSGGIEPLGSSLTSECLQDWVCWVYLRALQRLPAVVRQWWSGLDPRASSLVEQVTAQYFSPTLCGLEMESLQSKNGNMTVHVYGRAREVVARYHVEDVSLELSVVLPPNHPLGPVKVESVTRQPMVEHANWRNWIMQLTVFLAHQNGSLWDGLNLWKSNLDKRFEGIEECYICFSILHGSSFQIPKIRCDTCKKKFHSHCMYKWFDTSNKSTCPICRNFIL
ncbi:E3 ubiquitin-protein ligase listerin [Bacillus rossius redtenbacheri]|uniref:E3 ubiquitin-protein ligase listerin n=1 Tax=Bacillus rossius redtenbacheri TaxID=93214 RepID=UPI002FDDEEBA